MSATEETYTEIELLLLDRFWIAGGWLGGLEAFLESPERVFAALEFVPELLRDAERALQLATTQFRSQTDFFPKVVQKRNLATDF